MKKMDIIQTLRLFKKENQKKYVSINGRQYEIEVADQAEQVSAAERVQEKSGTENEICALMPGKILKILVKEGEPVSANQPLFIVESMKMDNELRAPRDGTVARLHVEAGDSVEGRYTLLTLV